MNKPKRRIIFIGLTITSSWGNGHATTFRSLVKGLSQEGHEVLFLERDVSWYAQHRDFTEYDYCDIKLYADLEALHQNYHEEVARADAVIVGSYVPEGVKVGRWVQKTAQGTTAFYDIDTPVTLEKLENEDYEYLHPDLIPGYDIYLSFTGGKTLRLLEQKYGAPQARALYCSVDTDLYYPEIQVMQWDLGYLGTYSPDRQPPLEELLLKTADQLSRKAFVVAGPQYPPDIDWPQNVHRISHLSPDKHRTFYNQQRFTLNITRKAKINAGFAPSVRLFEAAACATPIISDYWEGLDSLFSLECEILVAGSHEEVEYYLMDLSEESRRSLGQRARAKVLASHSYLERARQLAAFIDEPEKIDV